MFQIMTNSITPLAHWGIGTILIIIFAIVCIALTVIVLGFVFAGKKESDEEVAPPENENL